MTTWAPTSTRGKELTLLHVVHVHVWKARPHHCRVRGCPGWTGEPGVDRLDVWGPDGPPGNGVDVTMERILREL